MARAKERPNSFEGEGEEEQEWPEGDGQDGEQAGDGGGRVLTQHRARRQPRQVRSVALPSAQSPGRGPSLGRLQSQFEA